MIDMVDGQIKPLALKLDSYTHASFYELNDGRTCIIFKKEGSFMKVIFNHRGEPMTEESFKDAQLLDETKFQINE